MTKALTTTAGKRQNWLRNGWLAMAVIASIYYGVIWPRGAFRGVSMQRASALAAVEDRRHEHWFQPSAQNLGGSNGGVIGGVPGEAYAQARATLLERNDARKIVRTSSMNLVVERPAVSAAKVQQLAESAGGSLVNWNANGSQEATSASLSVRVPVTAYDATRSSILKLAQRVENEHVQAEDVTSSYVDDEARLRNLRAQEAQYLAILKLARNVKDTLEVSEKLNQVRGDIEQQQSEFNALAKQIDLVAINVSLRKETETQVLGLPWRPGYEFKFAARQGLEGLLDYFTSVLSFVFYLPAITLWMVTILLSTFVAWRILRRAFAFLFAGPKNEAVSN